MTCAGDTLTRLIGAWVDLTGALQDQKLRVDEQIAYTRACMTAMTKSDALMNISVEGHPSHLDTISHEPPRACQIKANEQGLKLLLSAVG